MNTEFECLKQLDVFGGEEILQLFDDGWDFDAKDDQIRLNGLARLLEILESNEIGEENSSLRIPILCKVQALSTAYKLGLNADGTPKAAKKVKREKGKVKRGMIKTA